MAKGKRTTEQPKYYPEQPTYPGIIKPVTGTMGKGGGPVPIRSASFRGLYRGFLGRLTALGCVYCPVCVEYVWPEHPHVAVARPEVA